MAFFCFAVVNFQNHALASTGEMFGLDSLSGSLAGATVAWGFQNQPAYVNPAGMSLLWRDPDQKMQITLGLGYYSPSFLPIQHVVLSNGRVADTETT